MDLQRKRLIATRYGYEVNTTTIDNSGKEYDSPRDFSQTQYSEVLHSALKDFVADSHITKITANVKPEDGAVENSIESFSFRINFHSSLDGVAEEGNAVVALNACEYYELLKVMTESLAEHSNWIPYSFDNETNKFTLQTIYTNDPTETLVKSEIIIVDSNYRRDFREFLANLEKRTSRPTSCYHK